MRWWLLLNHKYERHLSARCSEQSHARLIQMLYLQYSRTNKIKSLTTVWFIVFSVSPLPSLGHLHTMLHNAHFSVDIIHISYICCIIVCIHAIQGWPLLGNIEVREVRLTCSELCLLRWVVQSISFCIFWNTVPRPRMQELATFRSQVTCGSDIRSVSSLRWSA